MNGLFTYSEEVALKAVDAAIDGRDQINVVAYQLADEANITRSVMVNALKKAGLVGAIRTRNMGMKGTVIIITDRARWEELLNGFDA